MAIRRHSSSRHIDDLRLTIDCLPIATREAMLDGVRDAERIIVGAYTDGDGGVCPMLAAHRRGGRTNFLSFARAWDRFTRAGRHARAATRRERSILIRQLEASLIDAAGIDLRRAIDEHRHALARRESEQRDASGVLPSPSPSLRGASESFPRPAPRAVEPRAFAPRSTIDP
jgi:hypothetical protein